MQYELETCVIYSTKKKYLFYVREDDEEECCIFMERGPLEAYLHYLHIVDNNTQVYMRT